MHQMLCLLKFPLTISLKVLFFFHSEQMPTVAKLLILEELSQEELPPVVLISHLVTGLRMQFIQGETM